MNRNHVLSEVVTNAQKNFFVEEKLIGQHFHRMRCDMILIISLPCQGLRETFGS